jgi:FkbM family methyltransferase
MSSTAERFRYHVGKAFQNFIDVAVRSRVLPHRFPRGVHLEFDLQRWIEPQPSIIFDVGANVGDTVCRFARFFPTAQIHAFEPASNTFSLLEQRMHNVNRVHCRRLAVGAEKGQAPLALQRDHERNSLVSVRADAPCETVDLVSLDDYTRAHQINTISILKIDVEGYELEVLKGATSLLRSRAIQAIYAECGFEPTDRDKTMFEALHGELKGLGYRFAGLYHDFRWGPHKQWVGFSNGLWLLC